MRNVLETFARNGNRLHPGGFPFAGKELSQDSFDEVTPAATSETGRILQEKRRSKA